eukprot:NODE_55_length_26219_cov_0.194908.p9 type:complete len:266 gc:universal NODE_55_length_26219_cov_0.194908:19853-20650(+)
MLNNDFDFEKPLPSNELYFKAQNYDKNSSLTREYILTCYYNSEEMVEGVKLYDSARNKIFLKKSRIKESAIQGFKQGSEVSLFSRKFLITSYGNEETKLKVLGHRSIGLISESFTLEKIKLFESEAEVCYLQAGFLPEDSSDFLRFKKNDFIVLITGNRINPRIEEEENAYISESDVIQRMSNLKLQFKIQNEDVAVVILTTNVIKNRLVHTVLERLSKNLKICCAKTANLSRDESMNYLEIYSGVLPNITSIVNSLCVDKCIIL